MFDPLALTEIEVRVDGRHAGLAIPLNIKRHVHPRAAPPAEPAALTGIDYLGLIRQRREQELQKRIDYRNLPDPPNDRGAGEDQDQDDSKEQTGCIPSIVQRSAIDLVGVDGRGHVEPVLVSLR